MAAERLKFRCYQCTQLLAVSPSKAGSVVACPKCKAELLVPKIGPAPSEPSRSADTGPYPPIMADVSSSPRQPAAVGGIDPDSLIPPELANLRPEDLRIEAAVFESLPYVPRVESGSTDEPRSSGIFLNIEIPTASSMAQSVDNLLSRIPSSTPPPIPEPLPAVSTSAGAFKSRPSDPPAPSVSAPGEPGSGAMPAIPAIDIEPTSLIRPSGERRTVREVTLPATVVLAWSLFVLLALGMAFIAGLMIGHFVWKLPV
jgi:hypothetical protein